MAASRPLEKVSRDEEGADSSVLVLAKQISHGTLARFFFLSSKSENIKSRIEHDCVEFGLLTARMGKIETR